MCETHPYGHHGRDVADVVPGDGPPVRDVIAEDGLLDAVDDKPGAESGAEDGADGAVKDVGVDRLPRGRHSLIDGRRDVSGDLQRVARTCSIREALLRQNPLTNNAR